MFVAVDGICKAFYYTSGPTEPSGLLPVFRYAAFFLKKKKSTLAVILSRKGNI